MLVTALALLEARPQARWDGILQVQTISDPDRRTHLRRHGQRNRQGL